MNAVVDALDRAYGIKHIDMPATKIFIAIRAGACNRGNGWGV